jgi:CHASE3 domain sensor protein
MTGYIVLLILATGVSIYAVMQLDKVYTVTHSIELVDNPLINLHKDLSDALLSQTRYEKKFIIMRDVALYESFVSSGNVFEQYLREAKHLAASQEIKDLLTGIEELHEQYRTLFEEEAGYLKKGKQYSPEEYTGAKEKVVNEILESLSQVRLLSQESIFRKVADLDESGVRARSAVTVIATVSLLFGIGLSVVITRGITKPLREMQKKTGEIAAGVFKADYTFPHRPKSESWHGPSTSCAISSGSRPDEVRFLRAHVP